VSTPRHASRWAVAIALATVYLVWGSTYAAIRVALDGLPPLLLGGTRFLAAGLLLMLFALAAGYPRPGRRQVRDASFAGVLLLACGNGGVVWAEQHVATGLAAIIIATAPLWIVGLDALHPRGERLTSGVVLSFLLGLAGVALLMAGGIVLGQDRGFWLGVAALLFAAFAWALGSIYARHAEPPVSYAWYTAIEMLAGGAVLTLAGTWRGDWSSVDPRALLGPPLWGQLYLVFFGSLLAFSAYVWLLRAAPPALVATYAYVNPVVAIALGILLFGESLDGWTVAGSVVILISVVLAQLARQRKRAAVPSQAAASAPAASRFTPADRDGQKPKAPRLTSADRDGQKPMPAPLPEAADGVCR
jgi:drug/metabolite transporter (DMT)-like permease